VKSEGVARLLDLFEGVARSDHAPLDAEINELLSKDSIDFMLRAYSRMDPSFKEGLVSVLRNLNSPNPVGKGRVLPKIEEGFRACLNLEKISSLREKLRRIGEIDFGEAERLALSCLPPETPMESTVYLTIDSFNPGMVFEGNISFSILVLNLGTPDLCALPLAHELHHLGFLYWVRRNPKLSRLLFGESDKHEKIVAQLIANLLSEGLANYLCTPMLLHVLPTNYAHMPKFTEHNEKIKRYEQSLNQMLSEAHQLISDCLSKTAPAESCTQRLMKFLLDPEGILPPAHFIGGRLIEMFDKDSRVGRQELVDLCKQPSRFFSLYSSVAEKSKLPPFSESESNQLSLLLGEST